MAFSVKDRDHVMNKVWSTGSRHGRYKVMWVFFKANGRQF